jgi:hypothetical protein
MPSDLQNNSCLYVESTDVFDIDLLASTDVTEPAFKELLVRLYQNINRIRLSLNLKDSAYYIENEFLNGQVQHLNQFLMESTLPIAFHLQEYMAAQRIK